MVTKSSKSAGIEEVVVPSTGLEATYSRKEPKSCQTQPLRHHLQRSQLWTPA